MGSKILILGGARFHGYRLAEELSANGYDVSVLNRGRYRASYPFGIHRLVADRNEHHQLERALGRQHFDFVIDNNGYTSSQVGALLELIRGKCGHYLFISSAAVYLTLASNRGLREEEADGEVQDRFPAEIIPYAKNKWNAEKEVLRHAHDVPSTIVRLPNIFGEGDFAAKLFFLYNELRSRGKVPLEQEVRKFSLIYVEDVVNVIRSIIEVGTCIGRTINAADPVAYSYRDFFKGVFGDSCSEDQLVLMPAHKIEQSGRGRPFAWGPMLDASLLNRLIGEIEYTPLDLWGPKALSWEISRYETIPTGGQL